MPLVSRSALSLVLASALLPIALCSMERGAWAADPLPPPLPPASAPPAASALPPASAPAAAPAAPTGGKVVGAPDVVRLKSGGMLRGTISELVPDGDVVLITVTGEMRRFAMRDVDYAGPADGAPGAPIPAPPPPPASSSNATGNPVAVEFVSSTPDLMVHDRSGVATGIVTSYRGSAHVRLSEFRELCVAPCTSTLAPGGHTLAVSAGGGRIIEAEKPLTLDGPAKIDINYESRKGARTAGIVLMAGGFAEALIGPLVIIATRQSCSDSFNTSNGAFDTCVQDDSTGRNVLIAAGVGIAVGMVGLVVALVNKDSVSFNLVSPDAPLSRVRQTLDGSDRKHPTQAPIQFTRSGIGVTF